MVSACPLAQDTEKAHGEPPGDEELDGAKRKLGWPVAPRFFVPEDVLAFFRQAVDRGCAAETEWQARLSMPSGQSFPSWLLSWSVAWPVSCLWIGRRTARVFRADPKGMATRAASGKVLNALATRLPELIGGSADLAPSNLTWINGSPAFQKDSYQGRNFHFGVREHGMGAVVNGMAVNGGVIPYGGTFLIFSDYMRPAVRLSALSHYPSIWVYHP